MKTVLMKVLFFILLIPIAIAALIIAGFLPKETRRNIDKSANKESGM